MIQRPYENALLTGAEGYSYVDPPYIIGSYPGKRRMHPDDLDHDLRYINSSDSPYPMCVSRRDMYIREIHRLEHDNIHLALVRIPLR
jgi:hypothetical protein